MTVSNKRTILRQVAHFVAQLSELPHEKIGVLLAMLGHEEQSVDEEEVPLSKGICVL